MSWTARVRGDAGLGERILPPLPASGSWLKHLGCRLPPPAAASSLAVPASRRPATVRTRSASTASIITQRDRSPNGVSVIHTWQSPPLLPLKHASYSPYIISLSAGLSPSLPTVDTRSPARVAALRVSSMHCLPCCYACMHPLGVLPRRSHASQDHLRSRKSRCRIVYVPRPLTRLLGSMALQLLVA